MSIVLVYRSTKVINFAVGNMGLVGAGLLRDLRRQLRHPVLARRSPSPLVVGTAYGAVVELVVDPAAVPGAAGDRAGGHHRRRPAVAAILNAYPDLIGKGKPFPEAGRLDVERRRRPHHGRRSSSILVAAPLIAIALGWFLNRTLLGRTVRAAAGNPDLARLSGISPKLLSTLVWAIGGLRRHRRR